MLLIAARKVSGVGFEGPEGREDGGKGRMFYRMWEDCWWFFGWHCTTKRANVGNSYNNWDGGEPNNFNNMPEDHLHYWGHNGKWNDFKYNNWQIDGYICEYGGMPGDDTSVKITGDTWISSSCGCICPDDKKYKGDRCETCPSQYAVEGARADVNPDLYSNTDGLPGCGDEVGPHGPCLSTWNRGIHVPYLCGGGDCFAVTEGGRPCGPSG